MFSPFERLVAGRYLRARKAEGFVSFIAIFSFLGIMLGVGTLVIVMSVMNGFRAELVGRILGLNGHLNVFAQSGLMENYDSFSVRLEEIEGVRHAFPTIEGQALMTVSGNASGAMVRGMRSEDFARKPILSESVQAGDIKDFQGDVVALGSEMAKRMRLTVGDSITLIAPKGKAGPFGTMPRSRSYDVAVIFDVGMFEYNSGFIFMPLEAAQAFFQYPNAVTGVEIMTADPMNLRQVKQDIEFFTQGNVRVYDWRDSNSSFIGALEVERNVMFLILTLIIVVAAFNIISSMIMLVKDKSHDIAIMRTMGAARGSMMKIFILTGASIGFAGTIVGAVIGILFALNIEAIRQWLQTLTGTDLFSAEIYFLSQLPADIDWREVISVVGMALVLSILATLYPAWRAARLDPVEALRYE